MIEVLYQVIEKDKGGNERVLYQVKSHSEAKKLMNGYIQYISSFVDKPFAYIKKIEWKE